MNQPQPTLQQRIAASKELQQAHRDGIDLQLLWDNLQRPVSERLRRHQIVLDGIRHLRNSSKALFYINSVWNQMWDSNDNPYHNKKNILGEENMVGG